MVSNAQSHIIWHIILPHHQLHSFAHMQLHPKLLAETISATSSLNNTTSAAQKRTILTINQFAAPLSWQQLILLSIEDKACCFQSPNNILTIVVTSV